VRSIGAAPLGLAACALALACAHRGALKIEGPSVEVALDEGRPSERPLTPGQPFEILIRIDPKLPQYQLASMRFQLAQPGHLVFTLYAITGEGNVGAPLKTIDRTYGPEMISAGDDGKFVVEDLSDVPVQRGPIFLGIYNPEKEGDARLWATSNDSGAVFQREADPSVPLSQTRLKRTPVVRVRVRP
jgi:hypothetical protein